MNKKFRGILVLLFFVFALSIGFALLSTQLKINGTAGIHKNTWDIHWEHVDNEDGVTPVSAAAIDSEDNTTVNFEAALTIPGDYYEFTVDAVNKGTIDGVITKIETTINGVDISEADLPNYVKFTVKYADGTDVSVNDLLAVNKSITYKVRFEYMRSISNSELKAIPENGDIYNIRYTVTYQQHLEGGITPSGTEPIPKIRTNGGIVPGGEVIIDPNDPEDASQEFNILTTTSKETVLVGKYNLLVGNIIENYNVVEEIDPSTEGYNLQSSTAKGRESNGNGIGTVPFSNSYYWYHQVGPNGRYPGTATDYSSYEIYAEPYPFVYDSNSLVYSYVQNYVNILKQKYNMPSYTAGRIPTYYEAINALDLEYNNQSIIDNNSVYWLGTAASDGASRVYYVDTVIAQQYGSNYLVTTIYSQSDQGYGTNVGIRPVLVIPTKLLK